MGYPISLNMGPYPGTVAPSPPLLSLLCEDLRPLLPLPLVLVLLVLPLAPPAGPGPSERGGWWNLHVIPKRHEPWVM